MTFEATRRHRRNLPADATSFVGRRRELAQARRLLSGTRMLTLTGVGGVGKTRLGLRLAADVERAFPDGVWLVELAALSDERLLAQTVVDTLGISEHSSRPPVDVLCDFLADRQLLLALDNCEHLLDSCAGLSCSLLRAAPDLRILATSRQPLSVQGESILEVPPLPVPDPETPLPLAALARNEAVALFAERVGAVQPDFALDDQNAESVSRLCRRLDGIPLAIELAAVRLRCLSLEQILNRLDGRLDVLTGGLRGVPPRQRTLRRAVDWSYELCSAQEQLLWARLSVFSGGLDLEAAEEVCSADGLDRAEILHLISGLVDKSIIVRTDCEGPARYRLLETIRQYGQELLAGSGQEAALRRRHRDWYRHLAEEGEAAWTEPSQMDWLSRLAREHSNLRAALEFSLTEPGESQAALAIASALWPYWLASGSFTEARHWIGQALALDPEPTRARAKALWASGWYAIQQGDVADGLPLLDECRRLAQRLDDETALAWATQWSGQAAMFQRDLPRAIELISHALDLHRSLGNESGIVVSTYHLAQATSFLGEPRAAALGEELIALCERRHLDWSRSYALWVLGLEKFRQGDLRRATTLLRDSVRLRHAFRDRLGIALCIEVLAWTAGAEEQHERAAELLGAAQIFWRAVGASLSRYGHFVPARERCESRAKAALGDEAFDAAFRRSQDRSFDEAVSLTLNEPRRRPAAPESHTAAPIPLTPREREIAALLAQGMSNREIAGRLVIAQRTAEGHVEHILAKLGFHSRSQIAAWATAHLGGQQPASH